MLSLSERVVFVNSRTMVKMALNQAKEKAVISELDR